MHLQRKCSQLMEMPAPGVQRKAGDSPKHTGGSRCPGPPRAPSSAHPGTSALSSVSPPDGASDWQEGRSGGWLARPSTSTDLRRHSSPKPGSAPHLQKSACSESNKGWWRLPPAGASASVSMATPLPGQSRDSELPTATPWQPAPPEGGPRPSGAEEKLRPAPPPPDSPRMAPRAALITP